MNIGSLHPMMVHFPIACLIIYSLLEFITFLMPRRAEKLLLTKEIFLFVGVAAAWAALQTGEAAEHLVSRTGTTGLIIEKHNHAAEMTYQTYGFLALWYALKIVIKCRRHSAPAGLVTFMANRWVHVGICLFALFGMMMVTVTGALGGAMVYGPDADPMVRFIYDIVVK